MLIGIIQQIAAFVVPLLVIVGWITGHDLTLFFADFEVCGLGLSLPKEDSDPLCSLQTIVLFVSVLLVNFLIQYVHIVPLPRAASALTRCT